MVRLRQREEVNFYSMSEMLSSRHETGFVIYESKPPESEFKELVLRVKCVGSHSV